MSQHETLTTEQRNILFPKSFNQKMAMKYSVAFFPHDSKITYDTENAQHEFEHENKKEVYWSSQCVPVPKRPSSSRFVKQTDHGVLNQKRIISKQQSQIKKEGIKKEKKPILDRFEEDEDHEV
jgi:hypothetical protein